MVTGGEVTIIIEVALETGPGHPMGEIAEVDLEEIDDQGLIVTGQDPHLEVITEVGSEETGGQVQEDLEGTGGQVQEDLVVIEDQVQVDLEGTEDLAQVGSVGTEDQVQVDLEVTEDQVLEDLEGTEDQVQEDLEVTEDQVQEDLEGTEDQVQVDSVIVNLEDHSLTEMTSEQMIEDQDHMLIKMTLIIQVKINNSVIFKHLCRIYLPYN